MITPESQPAAQKSERRPFQYSLRAMFGLTTGTAAFFALARMLGYVDAVVILAAIVVLVGIMEYPRRVHLATGILLTLVAGMLLWANLRPTGWERLYHARPPDGLDPVARSMFYRGWPISPLATALVHGMRFHTSEFVVYGTLVCDGALYAVALLFTRGVCELCWRRRNPPPTPTGSTSCPPVE